MFTLKNKSQISNLTLQSKELEKEEQTKPKASRRKEIIKTKAEINKNRKKRRLTKLKVGFSKRLTELTSDRQTKKRRKKSQIAKMRNLSGNITTNSREIKQDKSTMNNCTPTNSITQMKWKTSQKQKIHQD